jgi:hypothetical protein
MSLRHPETRYRALVPRGSGALIDIDAVRAREAPCVLNVMQQAGIPISLLLQDRDDISATCLVVCSCAVSRHIARHARYVGIGTRRPYRDRNRLGAVLDSPSRELRN